MTATRYVAWLAWQRVRRRQSGALVAALGLGVGAAVLACLLVGVTVATDRSASDAVERLPADARAFRAAWFGVPAGADEAYASLDREVETNMPTLPVEGPFRLVLVRESTVAGRFVGLAAVDGLRRFVRLDSGRLPRRCTPVRCEVLRLRGTGRIPNAPGLRLVQVGTGTLHSRQLFGDFLEPTDNATEDAEVAPAFSSAARYHRPAPAPLVVAEGVDALASSPALASTYRSYAWVWPLRRGSPRLWDVDELIDRTERGRVALVARSSSFSVMGPVQELRAAERAATVSGRRLLLVGGEVAALLLAFAVLAARGMRRDLDAARRRLRWHGAGGGQLALLTVVESLTVAVAGVLLGWVAGGLVAGSLLAALTGEPVGSVLVESIASPRGILLGLLAVAVTTGLVLVTVVVGRSRGRVGLADVLALVALVAASAALLGGVADEDRLARSEGAGLVLLLVPGLLALAAAVASARLLPPLARIVARRGGVATRLAATGLGRGPGTMVATLAFLTLAFSLALLAEAYRATLDRAETEQAAYRVPLDLIVREDIQQLVPVLDAAPFERFRRLAGDGGAAYPVVRLRGSVGRTEAVGGVTVLGVQPALVEELRLWRDDWLQGGRAAAAAAIRPARPVTLAAPPVPAGGLTVRAGPSLVSLAAVVRLPGGRVRRIDLGSADAHRARVLHAAAPAGARLARLELVPPRIIERGADAGNALRGTITLDGDLARLLRGWRAEGGVQLEPTRTGVSLRYVITPQRTALVRPRQATDERPPDVLVTPGLGELAGGTGGVLPLHVGGESVPVRVGGVVERFPGVAGEAVVGDRGALQTALETVAPGSGRDDEVWLSVPASRRTAVASALAQPPFRALETLSRPALEADARRDPLARGTLLALAATAVVALVLAAIGLTLAVRADLRDDGGELYELEAEGAAPSLLRRIVRSRALVVSFAGLVCGALAGAVLVSLVTRVVTVTARAASVDLPLVTTVDPLVVAAGVALYVVLVAALVGRATGRAFASPRGPQAGDAR